MKPIHTLVPIPSPNNWILWEKSYLLLPLPIAWQGKIKVELFGQDGCTLDYLLFYVVLTRVGGRTKKYWTLKLPKMSKLNFCGKKVTSNLLNLPKSPNISSEKFGQKNELRIKDLFDLSHNPSHWKLYLDVLKIKTIIVEKQKILKWHLFINYKSISDNSAAWTLWQQGCQIMDL